MSNSPAAEVTIDLASVRSVTYSFADEAIGVIVSEHLAETSWPRPVVIGLTAQEPRGDGAPTRTSLAGARRLIEGRDAR